MLPIFLGIGAQRCGTTWLYEMLRQHPEICMGRRKEVRFFDINYEEGRDWYESFFSHCENEQIGEISPDYFHNEKCPERIHEMIPDAHLILMIRDPVERAHSEFRFTIRDKGFEGSFRDFLQKEEVIDKGFYYKHLKKYLQFFDDEKIFIGLLEEVKTNPQDLLDDIFAFLSVEDFSPERKQERINLGKTPRMPGFYRILKFLSEKLHSSNISWPVTIAKKLGLKRLLMAKEDEMPGLKKEDVDYLRDIYSEDVERLSEYMEKDLKEVWSWNNE